MTATTRKNIGNIVIGAALGAAFALSGYLFKTQIHQGERLSRIEETRFTSTDGATLRANLLKELPPRWVVERLDLLFEVVREQGKEINDLKLQLKEIQK